MILVGRGVVYYLISLIMLAMTSSCVYLKIPLYYLVSQFCNQNLFESRLAPIVDEIVTHGFHSEMTCHVMVDTLDGSSVEARAILDCASSASFISERLAQSLCLERSHQGTWRCWSFTEVPPSIYYQLH